MKLSDTTLASILVGAVALAASHMVYWPSEIGLTSLTRASPTLARLPLDDQLTIRFCPCCGMNQKVMALNKELTGMVSSPASFSIAYEEYRPSPLAQFAAAVLKIMQIVLIAVTVIGPANAYTYLRTYIPAPEAEPVASESSKQATRTAGPAAGTTVAPTSPAATSTTTPTTGPILPYWIEWMEANRMLMGSLSFFGIQMAKAWVSGTAGAFELFFGQKRLFSSLTAGRMPGFPEIMSMLQREGVEFRMPAAM